MSMLGNPYIQQYSRQNHQSNEALTQATYALAFEQRTANLIAAYTALGGEAIVGADLGDQIKLGKQIAERLGL